MKKRNLGFLAALLVLCMVLVMLPAGVYADEGWDGVTEDWPEGQGTAEEPYLISTAAELAWYRTEINKYDNTACAKLIDDIDLNGKDWTPIGFSQSSDNLPFSGRFDGNGHTIRGLYINTSNNESTSYNYGLFGYIKGVSDSIRAIVTDLTLEGSVAFDRAKKDAKRINAGGLCGTAVLADIDRCTVNVNVTVTKTSDDAGFSNGVYSDVGGLAGSVSSVNFTDCMNVGDVVGTGHAGGILGEANSNVTLMRCCNTGNVTGISHVGGIVGNLNLKQSFSQNCYYCYNTGAVNATVDNAGGLVGYLELSDTFKGSCEIIACFSMGGITAPSNAGGCFGCLRLWDISGTFSLEDVYYLDSSAEKAFGYKFVNISVSADAKTSTEMASAEFVQVLNECAVSHGMEEDVFKEGVDHPIFVWMPDEIPEVVPGDIDGNGVVDEQDVTLIIGHVLELDILSGKALTAANLNSDSYIDENDITLLIQIVLGQ